MNEVNDRKSRESSLTRARTQISEPERAAGLGHRTHDVIRRPVRNVGGDIQRHRDLRSGKAAEGAITSSAIWLAPSPTRAVSRVAEPR